MKQAKKSLPHDNIPIAVHILMILGLLAATFFAVFLIHYLTFRSRATFLSNIAIGCFMLCTLGSIALARHFSSASIRAALILLNLTLGLCITTYLMTYPPQVEDVFISSSIISLLAVCFWSYTKFIIFFRHKAPHK